MAIGNAQSGRSRFWFAKHSHGIPACVLFSLFSRVHFDCFSGISIMLEIEFCFATRLLLDSLFQ